MDKYKNEENKTIKETDNPQKPINNDTEGAKEIEKKEQQAVESTKDMNEEQPVEKIEKESLSDNNRIVIKHYDDNGEENKNERVIYDINSFGNPEYVRDNLEIIKTVMQAYANSGIIEELAYVDLWPIIHEKVFNENEWKILINAVNEISKNKELTKDKKRNNLFPGLLAIRASSSNEKQKELIKKILNESKNKFKDYPEGWHRLFDLLGTGYKNEGYRKNPEKILRTIKYLLNSEAMWTDSYINVFKFYYDYDLGLIGIPPTKENNKIKETEEQIEDNNVRGNEEEIVELTDRNIIRDGEELTSDDEIPPIPPIDNLEMSKGANKNGVEEVVKLTDGDIVEDKEVKDETLQSTDEENENAIKNSETNNNNRIVIRYYDDNGKEKEKEDERVIYYINSFKNPEYVRENSESIQAIMQAYADVIITDAYISTDLTPIINREVFTGDEWKILERATKEISTNEKLDDDRKIKDILYGFRAIKMFSQKEATKERIKKILEKYKDDFEDYSRGYHRLFNLLGIGYENEEYRKDSEKVLDTIGDFLNSGKIKGNYYINLFHYDLGLTEKKQSVEENEKIKPPENEAYKDANQNAKKEHKTHPLRKIFMRGTMAVLTLAGAFGLISLAENGVDKLWDFGYKIQEKLENYEHMNEKQQSTTTSVIKQPVKYTISDEINDTNGGKLGRYKITLNGDNGNVKIKLNKKFSNLSKQKKEKLRNILKIYPLENEMKFSLHNRSTVELYLKDSKNSNKIINIAEVTKDKNGKYSVKLLIKGEIGKLIENNKLRDYIIKKAKKVFNKKSSMLGPIERKKYAEVVKRINNKTKHPMNKRERPRNKRFGRKC